MGKRKGRSAKNAKRNQPGIEPDELQKAPHSFVFHRGHVGRNVTQLVIDVRKVMEPYTASKLKALRRNVVKDYVAIAGMMNVTHMVIFTKTEKLTYLRLCRLPRGPTMTFGIKNYSLTRDVISSLKKPMTSQKYFAHHPFLVLNNFGGKALQKTLMTTMFQNMFPGINVNTVDLNRIRRCLLLNYNDETKTIDFRHYALKVVPVGMSRGVKKLLQAKVPNLAKFKDVSELITKSALLSESEAELDGPHNEVTVPQRLSGRGNIIANKSAIRLIELGPRLTLELIKIEEGLMTGEVLVHEMISKTPEEIKEIRIKKRRKQNLKKKRKKIQEENVKKKEAEKEEHREKSLQGMLKKKGLKKEAEKLGKEEDGSEDDDEEWYRQEVGEEPEKEFMTPEGQGRKRSTQESSGTASKKLKVDGKRLKKNSQEMAASKKLPRSKKLLTFRTKRSKEFVSKKGNTGERKKRVTFNIGRNKIHQLAKNKGNKKGNKNNGKLKRRPK